MIKEETILTLSVEDLLGLLNSPQEEIVNAVRDLIKDQYSSVSDRWLISGLLDYYFLTNSKRMLDLLMGAPEPHCKYLLEKISSGMKGGEKFRFLSILLYAVSRNPPPIWIYKIPDIIMKDLLDILSPMRDSDMNVLVSGVMIIILLLPALPFEFNRYLPKVFECFWRLVHWTPNREQDIALKPYLQVAVYSLFQRLYALYPCNLLGYLRVNMVGQAKKLWFLNTLRPMLERVRLHPLLVSETKETEVSKNRWVRLEPSDLIQECAKLCLDPLHEICEEMHFSNPAPRRQSLSDVVPETSDFIVLCSSENSFWSPGVVQSPSTANTSIPHTPVYAYQLLSNHSTGIAESPPEAAIEATPETTPFTSPSPYIASKLDPRIMNQFLPKLKASSIGEISQGNRSSDPLSPVKKEGLPFKFPIKQGQDILLKSEQSHILQNKLQEIQRQRLVSQREEILPGLPETLKATDGGSFFTQDNQINANSKVHFEAKAEANDNNCKREGCRARKIPIYRTKSFEGSASRSDTDLFCEYKETKEEFIDRRNADLESPEGAGNEPVAEVHKRNSEEIEASNSEGLGLPSRHSMTELVKSVKTNRLRFLSQCGPPPNLSLLYEIGTKRKLSPNKISRPVFLLKQKSRSFPDLSDERYLFPSIMPKREFNISSLTLSPVKPCVETTETATQTEEAPIIDPYEQLLELLSVSVQSRCREVKETKGKESLSPYEILDQFIEYDSKTSQTSTQDSGLVMLNKSLNDSAKNHLRAMQCIMILERYKREVHAERNRRLLGKIKKLHLLQEKDLGILKEKNALKEEMMIMHQTLLKLQQKNNAFERKLNEMVEKRTLIEVQEKQVKAVRQRDHLKLMCESLQKEKSSLTKELENSKNSTRECQRQLKTSSRHSIENSALRNQVEDLNKKILIMGEIQIEMHQQMKNYKESQRNLQLKALSNEKLAYSQKLEELEDLNKADKTSLQAAMYRISELERKLALQHMEKQNHRREIEATAASWQERCSAIEKRNENLFSINSMLEEQMAQLLRFRPERENEAGAESRRLVAPTSREGFPLLLDSRESIQQIPEANADSFLSRMTSNEFRPIGSPRPID